MNFAILSFQTIYSLEDTSDEYKTSQVCFIWISFSTSSILSGSSFLSNFRPLVLMSLMWRTFELFALLARQFFSCIDHILSLFYFLFHILFFFKLLFTPFSAISGWKFSANLPTMQWFLDLFAAVKNILFLLHFQSIVFSCSFLLRCQCRRRCYDKIPCGIHVASDSLAG